MLLPTPSDLPLLDRQEAQVAIIKAHQQALEQATTLLRQMVETAGQVLSSEQLAAWSTYLYWRGDPEINLGWLAGSSNGGVARLPESQGPLFPDHHRDRLRSMPRPVHRLLRTAKPHGGPRVVHSRPASVPRHRVAHHWDMRYYS